MCDVVCTRTATKFYLFVISINAACFAELIVLRMCARLPLRRRVGFSTMSSNWKLLYDSENSLCIPHLHITFRNNNNLKQFAVSVVIELPKRKQRTCTRSASARRTECERKQFVEWKVGSKVNAWNVDEHFFVYFHVQFCSMYRFQCDNVKKIQFKLNCLAREWRLRSSISVSRVKWGERREKKTVETEKQLWQHNVDDNDVFSV